MTHYRKADGTAFTPAEIKVRTIRANRQEGVRKAAITRNGSVRVPLRNAGFTPRTYVEVLDGLNFLKPLKYTWRTRPQAHYEVIEVDVVEEVTT